MTLGAELVATVQPTLRMHEAYAEELTRDVSERDMDTVPGAGHENTPRFTIGHLCTGAALTRKAIADPGGDRTGPLDVPAGYDDLYRRQGPADRRFPERTDGAPTRDELLAEFRRQHALLLDAVRDASDEALSTSCLWKLGHLMPTHADLVLFVCSHEAMHLGQLAPWRRAMGLEAAMARMISA